jgi:hypothetical protein
MNPFTKKELIALKNGIEYLPRCVHVGKKYQEMCDSIIIKIQSMIDNYKCNHESDGLIYTSNPPKNKCVKCREFY